MAAPLLGRVFLVTGAPGRAAAQVGASQCRQRRAAQDRDRRAANACVAHPLQAPPTASAPTRRSAWLHMAVRCWCMGAARSACSRRRRRWKLRGVALAAERGPWSLTLPRWQACGAWQSRCGGCSVTGEGAVWRCRYSVELHRGGCPTVGTSSGTPAGAAALPAALPVWCARHASCSIPCTQLRSNSLKVRTLRSTELRQSAVPLPQLKALLGGTAAGGFARPRASTSFVDYLLC